MESHKFGFADALRGAAALCVVAAHFLGATYLHDWPLTTLLLGQLGVAVFFLVSGFVIPISLTKYDTGAFLVARVLRIYPTYAVALTITLATIWMSGQQPLEHNVVRYLSNYLIAGKFFDQLPFDGVVWTLEIELLFYFICVLIAPLIREFKLEALAAPAVIFLAEVWAYYSEFPLAARLASQAPFLMFMFGGVAVFYFVNRKINAAAMIAYCAGCCGLLAFAWWYSFNRAGAFLASSYAVAALIFLAALFWGARMRGGFFSRISYPLYVIHYGLGVFALNWLLAHSFPAYAAALTGFLMAVIAAVILHITVEMPTHRLGQRLARSLTGLSAGPMRRPRFNIPPLPGDTPVAHSSDVGIAVNAQVAASRAGGSWEASAHPAASRPAADSAR
jgi:peptidoglycan/LPS O-acetylase OafA/YrhL